MSDDIRAKAQQCKAIKANLREEAARQVRAL